MEHTTKQHTVIYNCKRCKTGRRVQYQSIRAGYLFRDTAEGTRVQGGIWVMASGGGRPTVYGGDVENGLCSGCGRMMTYGTLQARLDPDHKCDARCTGARGHNCECSCGGANHGAAWAAA